MNIFLKTTPGKLKILFRFLLIDFEYETDEKPPRSTNKLILIFWCPDVAKIKRKFTFSSTKDALKRNFAGIQKDFQASDISDIDFETIRKELMKL